MPCSCDGGLSYSYIYIDNKRYAKNGHLRLFDIRDQSAISCKIDPSRASEEFTDFSHDLCSCMRMMKVGSKDQEDDEERRRVKYCMCGCDFYLSMHSKI